MAGSPICPLSLCRGMSSLPRASLPAGGQGLSEGRLRGEERTRPETGTFCGRECFHSLSQAGKVSCLSLHVHSALQPLNYVLFGCQSDLLKSQTWLSQNTHPPPPPPSSQLRSFSGLPPGALRRTELGAQGWAMSGPGCPPQPHPIIPPDRTGLSDHHESACSLCQKASVCSYLCLGHSYTVPFPTLVLAHPSGGKKKS